MIDESYFTPGEWVLLIGLIAHALAFFVALWITRKRVQQDVEKIAADVHNGVEKIEEVRRETTSMRGQLESVARAEGRAAGILEGREEERQEGLDRRQV